MFIMYTYSMVVISSPLQNTYYYSVSDSRTSKVLCIIIIMMIKYASRGSSNVQTLAQIVFNFIFNYLL